MSRRGRANNVEGGVGKKRGGEQGCWEVVGGWGQGRMGQGPAGRQLVLWYLPTCDLLLLLCHAQTNCTGSSQSIYKSSQQPASRGLSEAITFLSSVFCLVSAPQPVGRDGMEILQVVAGRDHPRQAGLRWPVMCCGSLLSAPTRESPGPPGQQPPAAPCSVPDSCYASTRSSLHAGRSSRDYTTRHSAPLQPGIPISSLSISNQRPGRDDTRLGKAPAENNKRASACRDGGGFAAGIGMSSRPRPCPPPSSAALVLYRRVGPLVSSLCWAWSAPVASVLPVRATTSHLVFETLGSGAAVWRQSVIQSPCQCQVVAQPPRLLLLLLFPGRGPAPSVGCCGGHTDADTGWHSLQRRLSRALSHPSKVPKV